MDERKRRENERKFGAWKDLPDGGRRYFYEVSGRYGWTADVKEVDLAERTVQFCQEIVDGRGQLMEVHRKYPMDQGHRSAGGGEQ